MAPVLTVSGLAKSFSGPRVLDDVSLSIEPGEVRALVGQNGSGKSTLIKILAGFHDPDAGRVEVDGEELAFGSGVASEALGMRFVHQDLGLVDNLDTVDNLALGQGYRNRRAGSIQWRKERRAARIAMQDLGYSIDVRRPVGTLAMSERTAVAIARAIAGGGTPPKILVLDEPTANLPVAETERLFQLTRRVAEQGIAIVFVSHHFDEVFELSDSVTVLRDGKLVTTRPVQGLTEESLIELVIGRPLEQVDHDTRQIEQTHVLLSVENLATSDMLGGLSFDVRAGEIVGIAGITGSGRDEIAPAIFGGLDRGGVVAVDGTPIPRQRPDIAVERGIGLVPAQRHANAAFMTASIRENITLTKPAVHFKNFLLRKARERSDVMHWLEKLDVRPRNCEFAMSDLSGGNQQKVVICRWLRMEPKVLVLDEPTQGVDVGAKADIHELIDEAAAQGTAVLVVSTDHEELVRLCHRVLVVRRGRLVDELTGERLTPDSITAVTIGRDQAAA